jgi:hypothetical protein
VVTYAVNGWCGGLVGVSGAESGCRRDMVVSRESGSVGKSQNSSKILPQQPNG